MSPSLLTPSKIAFARIWLAMLSLLVSFAYGYGQKDYSLSVIIQDENFQPVEGANVLLYRWSDSVFIKGDISDAKGQLKELKDPRPTGFFIRNTTMPDI